MARDPGWRGDYSNQFTPHHDPEHMTILFLCPQQAFVTSSLAAVLVLWELLISS